MSLYNNEWVAKNFTVTEQQNSRLKNFCKLNRISQSQLFRLFIDELVVTQYDTTRTAIESASIKTQNFVGAYDREEAYQASLYNPNKQADFIKKKSSWLKRLNLF